MINLYLIQIIHYTVLIYTLLITIRVLSSWIPEIHHHTWFRFVCFYTDPYLNVFRRFIPPIGGILDLSPLVAFFALRLIENILIGILR